jgi:hypothetical protein
MNLADDSPNGQPEGAILEEVSDLVPEPVRKRGRPPKARQPDDSGDKRPTSKLLSAAKRAHDFKQSGRGPSRQLDIQLRGTPISGVYFRAWANPDEEFPVAILKVKNDDDRKEVYILSAEVADLPHLAPKARAGSLVPCVTSTGKVFVWAKTHPDPGDRMGFRIYDALARAGEIARKTWVLLNWDGGALSVEEPREPIEEPKWPTGQSLDEIFEMAIRGAFIDDPDHPVIRKLNAIVREV